MHVSDVGTKEVALGVGETDRATGTGNADGFEDTTVAKLFSGSFTRHLQWLRGIVRFDTTDVMRIGLLHIIDQTAKLFFELLTNCLRLGLFVRYKPIK